MTVRTVTDDAGVTWQVWEVIPGSARTSGPVTGRMPNVWGGASASLAPVATPAGDGSGWLVFMRDGERRRIAPAPPGWLALDDAQLARLLQHPDAASSLK